MRILADFSAIRDLLELTDEAIEVILESTNHASLSQLSQLHLGLVVDTVHASLATNKRLHCVLNRLWISLMEIDFLGTQDRDQLLKSLKHTLLALLTVEFHDFLDVILVLLRLTDLYDSESLSVTSGLNLGVRELALQIAKVVIQTDTLGLVEVVLLLLHKVWILEIV